MTKEYNVVIGIELHVELFTKAKLFCKCKTTFGEKPNTNICPICSGLPGTLPTLNKEAVKLAIIAGHILNTKINSYSRFDRKSYFYHDLPKGFQITQMKYPLCLNGYLDIGDKIIGIKQIHIEEDTGKSIYKDGNIHIDYNRCGIPLIEIVTHPCFSNSKEVKDFIQKLGLLLKYADVCDMKLEEGSFRVDVNLSLNKKGSEKLGTRVEIKNLGSIKSIVRAIDFEVEHQRETLLQGGYIKSDTKKYNENTGQTFTIRSKESIEGYKYIREYNIPPISLTSDTIDNIIKNINELPDDKKNRYIEIYGLREKDAQVIINKRAASIFFEQCVSLYNEPQILAKFIINEVLSYINNNNNIKININDFIYVVKLFNENKITFASAKLIIKQAFKLDLSVDTIIKDNNYIIEINKDNIEEVVTDVLQNNINLVEKYILGDIKLYSYFIGECRKKLKGNIDVKMLTEVLTNTIETYKYK